MLSECVTIDSCPSLLDNPTAPAATVIPCGFDEQQNSVKICCPEVDVTEPKVRNLKSKETNSKKSSIGEGVGFWNPSVFMIKFLLDYIYKNSGKKNFQNFFIDKLFISNH